MKKSDVIRIETKTRTDAMCSVFGNPIHGWKYRYNPEKFSITLTYFEKEIWYSEFHGISGDPIKDGYSEEEVKQRLASVFMEYARFAYLDQINNNNFLDKIKIGNKFIEKIEQDAKETRD